MLSDLIRNLAGDDPGVEIVGELHDVSVMRDVAASAGADLVVVPLEDPGLSATCLALLEDRPRARVLGLVADGREGVIWELRPHRERLLVLTPETLMDAVRAAALGGGSGLG